MSSSQNTNDSASQQINDLKKLVATISRGKLQWEATFDVISDPVVIIDQNYRITRANKAMAEACHLDVKDVIGKSCYKVFAGYNTVCPKCPVSLTLKDNKSHSVELDSFPSNKRQYFSNVYAMPESADRGSSELVLHYRDVTGEKELHKQLMQTDKMAAIGTLAGGIAHEINNPLGAILAHVQLASSELEAGHVCHESLNEIEQSVLRCTKIVRDLLDFSRQNFDEQMVPLSVNDVVYKTMALIHVNSHHSRITVNQNLSKNIPEIFGHFYKLEQVLINLVTNAIHAMRENGGELRISSRVTEDGKAVCLEISDTGHGIDEENVSRVFNPFFTTKEQGEGTGLGLSISYHIIKDHEGTIEVKSQKDKGTTFLITLPVYVR